ncbi:MAG: hypothetical protein HY040_25360 [Planctomycetes bacterium]|nr:hypothetical protein [Planctomycetota bacterium]
MFRGIIGKTLLALGAAVLLQQPAWAQESAGTAGCATAACNSCKTCQTHHCPPCFRWCQEGAPRLKFQHGCPKPICNPCEMQNWGYYQTCWTPWPFPPDYSHCRMPVPAAEGTPMMPPAAVMVQPGNGAQAPAARKGGL